MSDYRFQYVVTVKKDGSVEISPTEDDGGVERTANAIDIIDTSRKLIADLERQITLDALQQVVDSLATPMPPSASEKVATALKERGITPES